MMSLMSSLIKSGYLNGECGGSGEVFSVVSISLQSSIWVSAALGTRFQRYCLAEGTSELPANATETSKVTMNY